MADEPIKGIYTEIKDSLALKASAESLAALKVQIDDIQAKVIELYDKFIHTP